MVNDTNIVAPRISSENVILWSVAVTLKSCFRSGTDKFLAASVKKIRAVKGARRRFITFNGGGKATLPGQLEVNDTGKPITLTVVYDSLTSFTGGNLKCI